MQVHRLLRFKNVEHCALACSSDSEKYEGFPALSKRTETVAQNSHKTWVLIHSYARLDIMLERMRILELAVWDVDVIIKNKFIPHRDEFLSMDIVNSMCQIYIKLTFPEFFCEVYVKVLNMKYLI